MQTSPQDFNQAHPAFSRTEGWGVRSNGRRLQNQTASRTFFGILKGKNMMARKLYVLVAALVLGGLLTGCGRTAAAPPPAAPPVTIAPVEQQELVEWDEFTGRT